MFRLALLLALGCQPADPAPQALATHGPFLRDAAGGALLLRGVNLSQSAKQAPFHPHETETPEGRALLAAHGPVTLRYLTSWAAIEPEPGVYDHDYLDGLRDRLALLADDGHWIVLDLHQDLFGVGFAGGNGAPAWACDEARYATFEPRDPWFLGYATEEVSACFDDLFADEALLAQMADALAVAVEAALEGAGEALVGVDLLNEPWPGTMASEAFDQRLARYHDLAAERLAHLPVFLLFEPNVMRNLGVPTALPYRPDHRSVYAPHLYPPAVELGTYDGDRARLAGHLDELRREAVGLKAPLVVGEFGPPHGATGAEAFVEDTYGWLDEHFVGALYWDWSWTSDRGLLAAENTALPMAPVALRPHARRVAGTPLLHRFDPDTATLEVRWLPGGAAGPTEFVLPQAWYPDGVQVQHGPGLAELHGGLLRFTAEGPGEQRLVVRSGP